MSLAIRRQLADDEVSFWDALCVYLSYCFRNQIIVAESYRFLAPTVCMIVAQPTKCLRVMARGPPTTARLTTKAGKRHVRVSELALCGEWSCCCCCCSARHEEVTAEAAGGQLMSVKVCTDCASNSPRPDGGRPVSALTGFHGRTVVRPPLMVARDYPPSWLRTSRPWLLHASNVRGETQSTLMGARSPINFDDDFSA